MTSEMPEVSERSNRSRSRLIREVALSVGALAGVVCVLLAFAAIFFGITPLVFRSGSMAPAIDTGALAVSKVTPATDIAVGDIVNVSNVAGDGITHRVVEIGAVGTESVQLVLQGDANAEADVETYVVDEANRVLFSVPKLGYAVTWLSGPVAVFAGGVLVGVLMMIAWRPRGRGDANGSSADGDESPGETGASGRHSRASLTAILAIGTIGTIGALGLAATNTPTTLAAWNDTATARSGTFTTALPPVPVPGNPTCVNRSGVLGLIGNYVTMAWPTAGTGFTYRWTITQSGTSLAPTSVTTTSTDVRNGSLFGTRTGTWTFTVQTVSGTRVSAPSAGFTLTMATTTSLLNRLPSARCGTRVASTARLAPLAISPEPEPTTSTTDSTTTTSAPSTTTAAPSTTAVPIATEEPPPSSAPPAEPVPAPTTTTSTSAAPTAPANLTTPSPSPSGNSVATVVDSDSGPTLQITDSAGTVGYSGPITASDEYGYGIAWASDDQLWLLGPMQLVRFDQSGSGWSRTVVDRSATDEIPEEIAALL